MANFSAFLIFSNFIFKSSAQHKNIWVFKIPTFSNSFAEKKLLTLSYKTNGKIYFLPTEKFYELWFVSLMCVFVLSGCLFVFFLFFVFVFFVFVYYSFAEKVFSP